MKVILVGYEESKKILSATSYLHKKYLTDDFDIFYLNYGQFYGELSVGTYISLDEIQVGGSSSWSKYIIQYLNTIDDEFIIFSLDDYLQSTYMNYDAFKYAYEYMKNDSLIGLCKMGISPSYNKKTYFKIDDKLYLLNKNAPYSVTTQMNLWRKKCLIDVLSKSLTPWDFELKGSISQTSFSKIIGCLDIVFKYPEPSSISSRHPGKISVIGNKKSDIIECINKKYLNNNELIMGQWIGNVKTYNECNGDSYVALDSCPVDEKEYYKLMIDICLS